MIAREADSSVSLEAQNTGIVRSKISQPEVSTNMLEQISQEIASDPFYQANFPNDGQRFVAWYLRRVLLRDDAATRDDITDGADDKQIDAVIVDDTEQRVLIIQGKFINAGQIDAEPLREVLAAWVRLQDLGALQKDCNERLAGCGKSPPAAFSQDTAASPSRRRSQT